MNFPKRTCGAALVTLMYVVATGGCDARNLIGDRGDAGVDAAGNATSTGGYSFIGGNTAPGVGGSGGTHPNGTGGNTAPGVGGSGGAHPNGTGGAIGTGAGGSGGSRPNSTGGAIGTPVGGSGGSHPSSTGGAIGTPVGGSGGAIGPGTGSGGNGGNAFPQGTGGASFVCPITYPASGFYGANIFDPALTSPTFSTARRDLYEIGADVPAGQSLTFKMTALVPLDAGRTGWFLNTVTDWRFTILDLTTGEQRFMSTLPGRNEGAISFGGTGSARVDFYECGSTAITKTMIINWAP